MTQRKHRRKHRQRSGPHFSKKRLMILRLDRRNNVLLGVCAGIANCLQVPRWIVRVATLLLFFTTPLAGIVLISYFVLWFVLRNEDDSDAWTGYDEHVRNLEEEIDDEDMTEEETGRKQKEEAKERVAPSISLKMLGTDVAGMELRVRRMERFVASGDYNLHKELNDLERDTSANRGQA